MSLAATLLLWPAEALAQRGPRGGGQGGGGRGGGGQVARPASGQAVPRHPNTGPSHRGYYRPYYYRPYYYRPYYYPYYYPYFSASFYWGSYGWFPYYPYGFYPYGYYGGFYTPWYDDLGALRIEVKPRDAQVYVDGYFAGLVDDFDGISQRLRAKPGEHQIDLYMPGYQTVSEKLLFRPGATIKMKTTMQPLGAGEPQPPRPVPTGPPPSSVYDQNAPDAPPRRSPPPPYRSAPPAVSEPAPAAPPEAEMEARAGYGTLAIRVQPRDAVVLIDGERWEGDTRERLMIEVSEGTHRIEVQKPGFTTYSTEVRVRRGQVTTVNVSLSGGGQKI